MFMSMVVIRKGLVYLLTEQDKQRPRSVYEMSYLFKVY